MRSTLDTTANDITRAALVQLWRKPLFAAFERDTWFAKQMRHANARATVVKFLGMNPYQRDKIKIRRRPGLVTEQDDKSKQYGN